MLFLFIVRYLIFVSVSRYDPDIDRWSNVKSMHTRRLGVGVAVVNRLLYAVGGFDGTERLASVECYHPENNEWTPIPAMSKKRSGAGKPATAYYSRRDPKITGLLF